MPITILKGNIIHAPRLGTLECHPNSYLVAMENAIVGIFPTLPETYDKVPVLDYGDALIIPGLCDMHVHAPQFVYRGLGIDLQLMEWLDRYAFPTEERFQDLDYARIIYEAFVRELAKNGTTRAVIFGTIHVPATTLLMELLERYRICAYVGKVNMDTLSPAGLCETADQSLADTEQWIRETRDRFTLVKPAVTPRFIPTCSTPLLAGLGRLAQRYGVPIHSHISEDKGEMAISRRRYPQFDNDGEVYDHFGLLTDRTMMAHLIYPTDRELDLLARRGVTIACCAQSHGNVAAGITATRRMLDAGVKVGLGSDIAGGCHVSILRAMSDAIYMSKLRYLESGQTEAFLSAAEAFYLGTRGGGQFFGKVGSFEKGFALDALVIDDRSLSTPADRLTLPQRLERMIHLADDRHIRARFTAGQLSPL